MSRGCSGWPTAPRLSSRQFTDSIDAWAILLDPFCHISAAKIASLKATVALLLLLLIKSKLLRVKMSLFGSLLAFHMLVGFLITSGLLTLVAGGAVAYAATQRKTT